MNTLSIWITAARPKTLAASICPVLLGTMLSFSQGICHLLLFCLTLATALGIQISTNLANDYFDFLKGADTSARKGPLRVTQAGFVSVKQIKKAILLSLSLTALLGLYLVLHGGWIISSLLALSLLLAVLYTGGPYPLAYLGLGDLFVFLFFGPVAVSGTYFLQRELFSLDACIIGMGVGALSTAILCVNNIRDQEEDFVAKKKTLVVRFGKRWGQIEYISCFAIAGALPFYFFHTHPWTLLSCGFLLPAIPCIKCALFFTDPKECNKLLAKTGQILLLYSLLFCLGWIIDV